MTVVVTVMRVREKVRVEVRCGEGCGHRECRECGGGHYEKIVGRDGLCRGCREALAGTAAGGYVLKREVAG